jgi:hypothetical protein
MAGVTQVVARMANGETSEADKENAFTAARPH